MTRTILHVGGRTVWGRALRLTFLDLSRRRSALHERSAPSVGDHEAVMSVTELLRAKSSSTGGGADRRSLQRALLAGAGAAAASACAVVLPALLVWVASPQSTVDWTTALGVDR